MGDRKLTSPERQRKAKLSALQFVQEQLSQEDSAESDCDGNPAKKQCFSPLKPPNKGWIYSPRKPPNKGGVNSPRKTIKFKEVVIGLKDVDENANEVKPDVSSIQIEKNMNDGDEESECSQQSWQDESSQDSTQSSEPADPNKPIRKNGAKCPECGFVSPNRGELQKHMRKHTPDKPYACPIPGCDFRTRYPNNIRHHLPSHLDDRPFPCDLCELKFKRKSQLTTHMLIHTQTKNFSCEQCDAKFKRRWELKMHRLSHSDKKYFKCEDCGHETKTLSDLNKHKYKHRTERDYVCPICSRAYKDNRALRKHMGYTHGDNPPVECDICQKQFKNKVYLKKHQLLHEGHYPFSCEVCGMKFSSAGNKKNHMAVHSDEGRPYKCPVCPYAGKTELDVRAHIGVMHREERIYRCDICLIGFAKEQGLRQHYNTSKHKSNLEKLVASQDKVDVVVKIEREDEKFTASEEGRGNQANTSQNGTVSNTPAGDVSVKVEMKQEKEFEEMWGQAGGDTPTVTRLDSGMVVIEAQQASTPDSPTKIIQKVTKNAKKKNSPKKGKMKSILKPAPKPIEIAPLPSNEAQEEDIDVTSTDDLNNNTAVIKPIGTLTLNVSDNLVIKSEKLDADFTKWVNTSNTTTGGQNASLITLIKPEPAW